MGGIARQKPVAEDALTTMPITVEGKETLLLMAIDTPGNLHLLIPVDNPPTGAKPPDLNGLKVRHRQLEIGQFLDLVATPSHEQVFNPVCQDVISAVWCDRRNPWAAVASIIRAWQSAWKPVRLEMERTAQVGLLGELLVLRTLMIPYLGSAAIDQWSGPESERHDFVGDLLHLEVKTTRKSRHEHDISRLGTPTVPEPIPWWLCAGLQIKETAEAKIGQTKSCGRTIRRSHNGFYSPLELVPEALKKV